MTPKHLKKNCTKVMVFINDLTATKSMKISAKLSRNLVLIYEGHTKHCLKIIKKLLILVYLMISRLKEMK